MTTTLTSPDASPSTPAPKPARGLILHDAEVRQLLALGSVLVIRPIVPQPQDFCSHVEPFRGEGGGWIAGDNTGRVFRCPYGAPGEERFVRETFTIVPRTAYWHDPATPHRESPCRGWWAVYRQGWDRSRPGVWRSSSQMPEWASRARVRCEEVRALRLDELPLAPPLRQCWLEHYGKRHPGSPWVWAVRCARLDDAAQPLAARAEGGAE